MPLAGTGHCKEVGTLHACTRLLGNEVVLSGHLPCVVLVYSQFTASSSVYKVASVVACAWQPTIRLTGSI